MDGRACGGKADDAARGCYAHKLILRVSQESLKRLQEKGAEKYRVSIMERRYRSGHADDGG